MIATPAISWSAPLCTAGSHEWRPAVAKAFADLQGKAMREHFPVLTPVLDLPWVTIWEGELMPVSEPYRVRITDHRGMDDGRIRFTGLWPSVRVLSPLSRRADAPDDPVPHLYGSHDDPRGANLCLFHPQSGDWNSYMLLADSIVRWASAWLFYYEMWHVTGTWGGDEASHTPAPSPEAAAASPRIVERPGSSRWFAGPLMRSMPYLIP